MTTINVQFAPVGYIVSGEARALTVEQPVILQWSQTGDPPKDFEHGGVVSSVTHLKDGVLVRIRRALPRSGEVTLTIYDE